MGRDVGSKMSLPLSTSHGVSSVEYPECATVLRWDDRRGCWVLDELEISEPPILPRFALAFSNGAEACPERGCCCQEGSVAETTQSSGLETMHINAGGGCMRVSNVSLDTAVLVPGALAAEEDLSRASGSDVGRRAFNLDAPVFVPAQNAGDIAAGDSFNVEAPAWVPSQQPGSTGAPGVSMSSPQRTPLNSQAAAFVPFWQATA